MRWRILFRREINLTYARIQDIHLILPPASFNVGFGSLGAIGGFFLAALIVTALDFTSLVSYVTIR